MSTKLHEKITARKATVGIVGLGYVGLPLLMEFSKPGFSIVGFDIDRDKVQALRNGQSYIRHIQADDVRQRLSDNAKCLITEDFSQIRQCDAVLICVPTPLNIHRNPDLSFIEQTADAMGPYVTKDQLVVLESTTYPGTTEDVLIPIIEKHSGLTAGTDFYVAYSPEREDPANPTHRTATIPKVVGGLTPESLTLAQALYDTVICRTVPVSSCRAAEATKLMENIFRCVNIALVNELKVVFAKMNINIWEVIKAASTKPFGYMPFYPGPGLGGHCIPIDPFYLTWKAKEYGVTTKFIELAGEINTNMPDYVIQQTMMALNEHKKALNGSRVLLVGLAYKKNVDDVRESPTFVLWEHLVKHGARVSYMDPYCPIVRPTREHGQFAGTKSLTIEDLKSQPFDAAIVATDHDNVDYAAIARHVAIVVDTRNACADLPNVYRA